MSGATWKGLYSLLGLTDFGGAADQWPMSVCMLNVGKADALVIECDGETMLVDGGTADYGDEICQYLKRRGTESLKYVVNTHPDSDHAGGIAEVLEQYEVGTFLWPHFPEEILAEGSGWEEAQKVCREKGILSRNVGVGELLYLGDMRIEVLGPVKEYEDANDNSVVLRLVYGESKILLTGDAEEPAEKDLIERGRLEADVLKVGHHGSSTSTSAAFLEEVMPETALISVGPDRNNLPRSDVLARLREAGADIYRTDFDGSVLVVSDGKTIKVITEEEGE